MPNWCYNTLVVRGKDKKTIDNFVSTVNAHPQHWKPSEMELQFNDLPDPTYKEKLAFCATVPLPPEAETETYSKFGYDWQIKHWGTKWGACEVSVHREEKHPDEVVYSFETAWSPPEEWVRATAEKYPDLRFSLYYTEEANSYAGHQQWQGSKRISMRDFNHSDLWDFVQSNLDEDEQKEYKNLEEDESWEFLDEIKLEKLHLHAWKKAHDNEAWEDLN
tara:strand:+ start:104 stop:760 length:657 start_codon:yes stop_codon:yes gene_type:complete